MYYVNRKVGRKFGVIDSNDNVEEFYSMKALEEFTNRGVEIQGCAYIRNKFTVTPIKICSNKFAAAKHKLSIGASSGIHGLDLKFEGDKVIALPLNEDFFSELDDFAYKNRYILEISSMVTHIAENFFKVFSYRYNNIDIVVKLPHSLLEIESDALCNYIISDIEVRGILNKVWRSKNQTGSLLYKRNVLRVKILESYSLRFNGKNSLYLPDITHMDYNSIIWDRHDNLHLFLGKDIKILSNCVSSFRLHIKGESLKLSITNQLMSNASIIWLDDSCDSITTIDMNKENDETFDETCLMVNAYIFVLSNSLFYKKLQPLFRDCKIGCSTTVGILTYENKDGYIWLRENLRYYCQHYRQGFETYFTKETLGKCIRLKLK